ncbi:hypothetical protein V2J09_020192 [Rumex salicifolius]
MASTLSLLHLLLFTLYLHSTAIALQFSDDVYEFFQQDLSRAVSPSPQAYWTLHSPSLAPSPAANRISNDTRDGPIASAFFIFGDSSVDCGTNNFLGTLARADRLPYGRDFDTHKPTGRFCNGRLAVDYLALHLGLPLVPSYLGRNRSIEEMMHGVNYASAASGIIFSSGSELGQHVSLTQQIQQYMDTFDLFITSFGEESAVNLISSSVFYISIGTNDYIHYYLRNVSGVQTTYFPWSFNLFLVNSVRKEIRKLYDSSARKVVVMGLAPMGCAPHYLWKYNSTNGECIQEINDMITEFNYGMRYMVQELNRELHGASIIFCDVFASAMELIKSPGRYGYSVTTDACCGVGKYKGWILCISPLMACHNASTHIWWDQFHPTDAVNEMLADNIWSGLHSNMCYPINLREMDFRYLECLLKLGDVAFTSLKAITRQEN